MYSNENISYSSQCTHKLLFQIQTLKHLSLSWRPGRGWRTRCLCFTPIVGCLPHPRPPPTLRPSPASPRSRTLALSGDGSRSYSDINPVLDEIVAKLQLLGASMYKTKEKAGNCVSPPHETRHVWPLWERCSLAG